MSGGSVGCAPLHRHGWYQRLQALVLRRGFGPYERAIAGHKRRLLGALEGRVLEIGPGPGTNLEFLSPGVEYVAVEPNPFMLDDLRREAERRGVRAEVQVGAAEALPVPDASVDAVVCSLVLCTVRDVPAALGEIRRVLRPGGRLVFIEHVAAPPGTVLRWLQRILGPAWRVVADGCHPDRETAQAIESAGFARVELERFRMPAGLVAPHVAGTAVRG